MTRRYILVSAEEDAPELSMLEYTPTAEEQSSTPEFAEFPEQDVENSIVRRFEQIAARYPEQVAVRAGSRSLTYVELDRAANRVAQSLLAKRGTRPEPVGLLLGDPCDEITCNPRHIEGGKVLRSDGSLASL